eukprot:GHVU01069129.1.p1 GENE.GHVU01069129.1~~GHVU01069129.1.p1  ORF type:complete len:104 (-),score=0.82 GHVU01069129.1:91-402(-)
MFLLARMVPTSTFVVFVVSMLLFVISAVFLLASFIYVCEHLVLISKLPGSSPFSRAAQSAGMLAAGCFCTQLLTESGLHSLRYFLCYQDPPSQQLQTIPFPSG